MNVLLNYSSKKEIKAQKNLGVTEIISRECGIVARFWVLGWAGPFGDTK